MTRDELSSALADLAAKVKPRPAKEIRNEILAHFDEREEIWLQRLNDADNRARRIAEENRRKNSPIIIRSIEINGQKLSVHELLQRLAGN